MNSLFIRDRLPGLKPLRFHYIPLFGSQATAVGGVAGTAGGTDVPTDVPATSATGDRETVHGDGRQREHGPATERAIRTLTIAELEE